MFHSIIFACNSNFQKYLSDKTSCWSEIFHNSFSVDIRVLNHFVEIHLSIYLFICLDMWSIKLWSKLHSFDPMYIIVCITRIKGDYWGLWHFRLWSFQGRNTKLERFLAKNQLYSNEISKFWKLESWGAVKKYQYLTFKVNFLCQKSLESFWFFFNEEYQLKSTFVVIDIFW